jgi:hypothetical protein
MLRLYGIPITPEEARYLVATLIADGGPDTISAAAMIERGLDRELFAVALEHEHRDTILSVLENPPEGLEGLRSVLARDHADRTS